VVVEEVLPLPPLSHDGLLILPFSVATSSSSPPAWQLRRLPELL
jgi:hypothetical protein